MANMNTVEFLEKEVARLTTLLKQFEEKNEHIISAMVSSGISETDARKASEEIFLEIKAEQETDLYLLNEAKAFVPKAYYASAK